MNILVTYSEPKDAEMLLDMACYIREAWTAFSLEDPGLAPFKLTILTVVHNRKEWNFAEESQEKAQAFVHSVIEDVGLKICLGRVDEEILREALSTPDDPYDIVLMGIHPPAKMLRPLLTSTTEKVAQRLTLPLLVVRGKPSPLRRILICDSGMERQPLAGQVAAALPGIFHSGIDVTLLHVMSQIGAWPGVKGWELQADAQELMNAHTPEGEILERDLQMLEGTRIRPRLKVRHGSVLDEILTESKSGDYDLIVIGAHAENEAAALLLEDMTREILLSSPCPVCVVHRKQLKERQK